MLCFDKMQIALTDVKQLSLIIRNQNNRNNSIFFLQILIYANLTTVKIRITFDKSNNNKLL